MVFNFTPLYFGLGMSVIDIGMESLSKYYVLGASKNIILIIAACLLYAIQPILFSKSLKIDGIGIGIMNIIWNVISTCIILAVGVFLFSEKMNAYKWAGVIFSVIALILLSIGNGEKK
jgi:multidrug transporter EmrE-like cation transporter